MISRTVTLMGSVFFCATVSLALDHNSPGLFVRVVDVGAGHCAVVKMPGDHYMIYDAGNFQDRGASAFDAVQEIIPEDQEIELLVLSHSDADHLAAADEILDAYTVKRILRTGMRRNTATWGGIQRSGD